MTVFLITLEAYTEQTKEGKDICVCQNSSLDVWNSTVGINPRLSDPLTPRTSKLGWRYFEANKIDRNELQIRKYSQKCTGTKMAEKLNNFEKFERKKVKFQPCS